MSPLRSRQLSAIEHRQALLDAGYSDVQVFEQRGKGLDLRSWVRLTHCRALCTRDIFPLDSVLDDALVAADSAGLEVASPF